MDIKALREMLSKNELSISDEAYSSLIDKFDTSDDGKLSAKEISAMISKYNTDNNLDEFSDSEIEQMAYDVCGFNDETLSHIPSDAKTYIRDGFKNMLSGFFSKVQSDDVQKTSPDPTAPKYAQKDEDGKYYVDVEPWTSSGKRKNDVDTKGALLNNCPERIIKNAYPDIEPYSDQWNQLVNLVMEANPNI